jgi:hypothetical protein
MRVSEEGMTLGQRLAEMVEDSEVRTACAWCGQVVFEGPLRESRAAFREHVAELHPEHLPTIDAQAKRRPKSASLAVPSRAQIDTALLRRLQSLNARRGEAVAA